MSIFHEQVKNPFHQQNHWWNVFFTCSASAFFYPSMNGRSWTCLFGPSMNKIVCQEPLFSRSWTALWRWWTPPYSLVDYLATTAGGKILCIEEREDEDVDGTGSSISFDTKRTYVVQKQINFSTSCFFLLKELHMMFFVSKYHGTGSIRLGDSLF